MQLLVNVLADEMGDAAAYARAEGLGVEITAFAWPQNLDPSNASLIRQHAETLGDIRPLLSHGPFLDLAATSHDSSIVDVCRERHQESLRVARELGACVYVAHTNYNPLIRNAAYRRGFAPRMREFWLPFADEAGKHGITIVLENLWEDGPETQRELIDTIGHPFMKASFDNGHALVFSKRSSVEWIQILGTSLAHLHLHDNHGETDEHLPCGEGVEDWHALLGAVIRNAPQAYVVAESDRLRANQISIARIRECLQVM